LLVQLFSPVRHSKELCKKKTLHFFKMLVLMQERCINSALRTLSPVKFTPEKL
jgi:hypothetical protein